jgi:phosphatidylglycerophosphate synthase
MSSLLPTPRSVASLAVATAVHVGVSGAFVVAFAFAVQYRLQLAAGYPYIVTATFAAAGAAVAVLAGRHLSGRRFGAANQVTLLRTALAALLLGLIGQSAEIAGASWLAAVLALPALLLDGLDGWLARRLRTATAFGARFDMETDAALILVLALLVWRFDKGGAWVLAGGLARYVFVAAASALPWLQRRLPDSRRRQTVCVIAVSAFALCLVPPLTRPASTWIALAGVAALLGSFAVDVLWLARRAATTRAGASPARPRRS